MTRDTVATAKAVPHEENARQKSRVQTADIPNARTEPVLEAIVQAIPVADPELHLVRRDQVPTPPGRAWNATAGEAGGDHVEVLVKVGATSDRFALLRRPGAELCRAWACSEVCV